MCFESQENRNQSAWTFTTGCYGSNGWFFVASLVLAGGSATIFNTDYGTGHLLELYGGSMTPKDAWAIDKKIDDGKPGMGNVVLLRWAVCTNAANMSDLTATYTLSATATTCSLFFLASF